MTKLSAEGIRRAVVGSVEFIRNTTLDADDPITLKLRFNEDLGLDAGDIADILTEVATEHAFCWPTTPPELLTIGDLVNEVSRLARMKGQA